MSGDYYGDVRRARIEDAQLLLRLLSLTFEPFGWLVSGHGSTFVVGAGRDIDFVFNRGTVTAIPRAEVIERLGHLGVQLVTLDELRTSRAGGMLATFAGLAIDITFFDGEA